VIEARQGDVLKASGDDQELAVHGGGKMAREADRDRVRKLWLEEKLVGRDFIRLMSVIGTD